MQRLIVTVVLFVAALNVLLSSWWLLHGNLIIKFDISRDLMIWYDLIFNKHLILIGGHSGTINGVFHGPLWYYLNLPPLLISQGSPLFLGWFWILLSIMGLFIIYVVGKRLFSTQVALTSILIFSTNSIINIIDDSKYFYNPYGAVLLFPLFFYLFYKYLTKPNVLILFISLLTLGLIIQFQIAFGVPILLLTLPFLVLYTTKKKRLKDLLCIFILIIPLATFIVFELRHNFLQTNATINYIFSQKPQIPNFPQFIYSRLDGLFLDNFKILLPEQFLLAVVFSVIFFLLLFIRLHKSTKNKGLSAYILFSYFYFGFGAVTFFFWGEIVNYYWPFLPLMVILLCSLLLSLPKKFYIITIILLLIPNYIYSFKEITSYNPDPYSHGMDNWDTNLIMAKTIYEDTNSEFGYYIFTPDLFGYTQRYAMEYTQNQYPLKKAYPFKKLPATYLIIQNPPNDRPDRNGLDWKMYEVKITSEPEKVFQFRDFKVERYSLSEDDLNTPSSGHLYLLNNLYFR